MRKTLLTLSFLALLAGCSEPQTKNPEIRTKNIEYTNVTPLEEGSPHSFEMKMDIEWPEAGLKPEALKKMQLGVTELLFESECTTTDIDFAIATYDRHSADHYRSVNDSEYVEEEWGFMLDWSEYIKGSFLPEHDGMISYTRYISGYSGGAHGMDHLTARIFSLKSGEVITEEDLFKPGYIPTLTKALRGNLLESFEKIELLWDTEIDPSDDYYITPEGITYIYQRYDISSYAMGIIKITVPWDELKDILR
jgi:hypothetical protein